MKLCVAAFAALLFAVPAAAGASQVIALWPGTAPGSESWSWSEASTVGQENSWVTISNVVKPEIAVHLPAPGTANGTGIVVMPGGGFVNLAYGKEGEAIADWLNSIGVTAFVVKYRVAHTAGARPTDAERQTAPAAVPFAVADAKQAMRLVRLRAAEFGLKPGRIGAMGFSAGGWLALLLGTATDAEVRPDFLAPIYPGTPVDLKVPSGAPPAFFAVAADDQHVPQDAVIAFTAWRKAGVSAELHVYGAGRHGFALRKAGLPVDTWNDRFVDWLKWQKLLP